MYAKGKATLCQERWLFPGEKMSEIVIFLIILMDCLHSCSVPPKKTTTKNKQKKHARPTVI